VSPTPLVSIGIPTYDRPEMLGAALVSAVEQTYEHLEILVADDGTNPETEAVVREIAGNDPRVTYERNERNLGGMGNGVKVLQWASGEYQKMLLDDDLLEPHFVQTLIEPMIEDETITLGFSKRTIVDEHGVILADPPGMSAISERTGRIPAQAIIQLCASTTTNWIGEQSTVLFRSSVVNKRFPVIFCGAAPSGVLGDLAMHLGALARGDAWYTPEPLSKFRQHGGQRSNDEEIHTIALSDWVMIQERIHLIGTPLSTSERMASFARIIGALSNNLAYQPNAPAAERGQDDLERAVRHLRELREHDNLVDVPRVSIVLLAHGAADQLLPQLEAIIQNTPPDAFEVVIGTIDPTEQTQQLLSSLEGDLQVVDVTGAPDPVAAASERARHEIVTVLTEGERPRRGWIADLLDARLVADLLDVPAAQ
jgi:hypothetical protein